VANPVTTTLFWPIGIALTSWSYIWRITILHRRELDGSLAEDAPPPIPAGVDATGIQTPEDGAGPLFHRTYRSRIRDSRLDAAALIARLAANPDDAAPVSLARFQKQRGEDGRMAVGDEFVVRMPGPWDGPVRCIDVDERAFRFATLDGHLEAGQIEWAAADGGDGLLEFRIESRSRAGDRLSALLHDHLRMAKEVQLHMWTSVHERVAKLCGGRLVGGIDIETRRVDL
jgi:hypothetical protein